MAVLRFAVKEVEDRPRRVRYQKRTKKPKVSFSARGLEKIHKRIERDAARFGVSKSFVICVILAEHYNIIEQEPI